MRNLRPITLLTLSISRPKSHFIFGLVLGLSLSLPQAKSYYGSKSSEAILRFETTINAPWSGSFPSRRELNTNTEVREKALNLVNYQILHMDGVFHSSAFSGRDPEAPKEVSFGGPASCGPWYHKNMYNLEFTDVQRSDERNRIVLKYKFAGQMIADKQSFSGHSHRKLPLWLPIAPDRIFQNDIKWGKNQCTSKEDPSEGGFYYFWNPWQKNCSLKNDQGEKINWISADVDRIKAEEANDLSPDYDSLYGTARNFESTGSSNSRGKIKTLTISHFIGYVSHHIRPNHPSWKDEALYEFRKMDEHLTTSASDGGLEFTASSKESENLRGFRTDYKTGQIISGPSYEGNSIYKVYEKTIKAATGNSVRIRFKLLVADTALENQEPALDPESSEFSPSRSASLIQVPGSKWSQRSQSTQSSEAHPKSYDPTFKNFYLQAVRDSDIIMYDGHSGDGDNLSPLKLNYTIPANKYLVLFINGCDSYLNYLGQFLMANPQNKDMTLSKPRLGNIDLVMSSTPVYTTEFAGNAIAFLDVFLNGEQKTYKQILDSVERSNHFEPPKQSKLQRKLYPETFLVGVKVRGESYDRKPSIDRP